MALFSGTDLFEKTPLVPKTTLTPYKAPTQQPESAPPPLFEGPMLSEEAPPSEPAKTYALTINGQDAASYLSRFKSIDTLPKKTTWSYPTISTEDKALAQIWGRGPGDWSAEEYYDWVRARWIALPASNAQKKDMEKWLERNDPTASSEAVDIASVAPRIIYDDNGLAIAQVVDYKGQTYLVRDLTNQAQQLLDLQKMIAENPNLDLDVWMAEHGYEFQDVMESGAYAGLQALIAKLQNPETQTQWQTEGLDWAGQLMGLGAGEYAPTMKGLMESLQEREQYLGGEGAMPGLAPTEQKELNLQMARMREDGKMMMESLAGTGRSAAAFMEGDRVLQTMASAQLAYVNSKSQLKLERMQVAHAAEQDRWKYMLQVGQMSATEYIQRQREHAGLELTMYANEVAMIESANSSYLQQHQQDLTAFMTHADMMYQQIVLGMQVDQATMDHMQQYYEMMMAPIAAQMQQDALDLQQRALDQQEQQNMWSNAIAIIGLGVNAIFGGIRTGASAATGAAGIPGMTKSD